MAAAKPDEVDAAKRYVKRKKILTPAQAAAQAGAGKDMGSPGKGFDRMVQGLTPKYGADRAKRIAGAQFQRMRRKGQL